jgi:alcohol dehydrogenase
LGIVGHPGAFREFLTLPERNLHVVPDSVSTEAAVFTEPLAAACEIMEQVRFARGTEIAVLGDGKLGLLIAQVLHAHGLAVKHYGRHKEKLLISARSGIETEMLPRKLPAAAYDCVVEATGSTKGMMQAVRMVRPCGTIVMKSTVHGAIAIDTSHIVVNEITLVGSRCGRFEPALKLLRQDRVRVLEMISERMPLSEAPRAFGRAAEKGVLKVLLQS